MQELLALYEEVIKAASDDQILPHLTNLVQDAAAMANAVAGVLDQARTKATQIKNSGQG